MSRFTLDNLYGQQKNLLTAISDQQTKKAELLEKIRRLEKASSSLGSNITGIEDSYKRVVDLTIDESMWRGTEKNKFDNQKNAYQNSIKGFSTDTESARDQVDAEISRLEASIASIDSTISHFNNILANVNAEINARGNR